MRKGVQDNSAQNQLGPCQLGPHKNRPMPTRPKMQNSAHTNSANLSFMKDNSSHIWEGLKYVCFIICDPSRQKVRVGWTTSFRENAS